MLFWMNDSTLLSRGVDVRDRRREVRVEMDPGVETTELIVRVGLVDETPWNNCVILFGSKAILSLWYTLQRCALANCRPAVLVLVKVLELLRLDAIAHFHTDVGKIAPVSSEVKRDQADPQGHDGRHAVGLLVHDARHELGAVFIISDEPLEMRHRVAFVL